MQLTDHIGYTVNFSNRPQRIISLVPSQTELLAHLGLEQQVAGITKFCIHPEHWFRSKLKVGGTKNIDREKIQSLQPDLVIANKEENDKEQVDWLRSVCPVFVTDVRTLENALTMIEDIGIVTDTEENAQRLIAQLNKKFSMMAMPVRRKTCVYLIWNDPLMAAGGDTFINSMLEKAGFDNVFAGVETGRYPKVNIEKLQHLKPDVVMLSSEPFPFVAKHRQLFEDHLPHSTVVDVDGEMFSWYGSRLLHFDAQSLQSLLGMN